MSDTEDPELTALLKLSGRFQESCGLIRSRAGVQPTPEEFDAIDYLCAEWDYSYAGPVYRSSP